MRACVRCVRLACLHAHTRVVRRAKIPHPSLLVGGRAVSALDLLCNRRNSTHYSTELAHPRATLACPRSARQLHAEDEAQPRERQKERERGGQP